MLAKVAGEDPIKSLRLELLPPLTGILPAHGGKLRVTLTLNQLVLIPQSLGMTD